MVAVLAFLLLGSGGTQLGSPVAQAATLSSSTPGYRVHMWMQTTSSALDAPITATGNGVVDLRDHAIAMSLAMDLGDDPQVIQQLGSSTMRLDMVLDGATAYVKLPSSLTSALGASRPWVKLDLAKLSGIPGLSSLTDGPSTSDPTQALEMLRSASGSFANLGQQQVDGFQTTHYRLDMSVDRLADNLPAVGAGRRRPGAVPALAVTAERRVSDRRVGRRSPPHSQGPDVDRSGPPQRGQHARDDHW